MLVCLTASQVPRQAPEISGFPTPTCFLLRTTPSVSRVEGVCRDASLPTPLASLSPACIWDVFPSGLLWCTIWRPGRTGVCVQGTVNHKAGRDLTPAGGMSWRWEVGQTPWPIMGAIPAGALSQPHVSRSSTRRGLGTMWSRSSKTLTQWTSPSWTHRRWVP